MNKPFIHRFIDPPIIALVLSIAVGLSHAASTDDFPQADSDELKSYLSSHNYQTPESCRQNADGGSCWARSIMSVLSEQELSQLWQQAEDLEYTEDQPVNAAALHIYLESFSAGTPEGATPGVPINHLNTQLAILLKKKILTITPLADGSIATQIFTGFEDGSYEVEENIISLSEEPEALFTALSTADISLFLTPGENEAPGHVQPIVLNLQAHQTPVEALLKDALNQPVRPLDIFAGSSADIPPYLFSALQFGVRNVQNPPTGLSWGSREHAMKTLREIATERKRLARGIAEVRKEAAKEYNDGSPLRFCKRCVVGAFKFGIIGAASATFYQNWRPIKYYFQSTWKETIAPKLPVIMKFINSLPKKGHEAWKYLSPKVSNFLKDRWHNSQWPAPHLDHAHWPNEGIIQSGQGQSFANQILMAVNAIRSQQQVCGNTVKPAVRPLRWNYSLEAAAFKHATDMANGDFMNHTGSDGSKAHQRIEAQGYRLSISSENIAVGQLSIDEVLKSWMSSKGHCENIMNPKVTEMGVSVVKNPSEQYKTYWAQVFASPLRHADRRLPGQ
ncbi:CAP domain-containing protein [Endozoicomonas sp. 4G]|uniref:CAP domain-containing protein n=1 Tax=Endozoicomonas sp. 4G TaxID=2872754 RepID=UPI002078CF7F|nr:CAP domain-containing protein [Endozoicomonas sp. 4G]